MMKEYVPNKRIKFCSHKPFVETEGYMEQTRAEETINFAKKLEQRK